MKTNKEISYGIAGFQTVIIPKGTPVIPADNIPQNQENPDNDYSIQYWVKPWAGMSEEAESHERTYGFGVSANDVEEL